MNTRKYTNWKQVEFKAQHDINFQDLTFQFRLYKCKYIWNANDGII